MPTHDPRMHGAPTEPPSFQPTPIDGRYVQQPTDDPRPHVAHPDAATQQPSASPSSEPSPTAQEQARGGPGAAHMPFFGEAAGPRRRTDDDPDHTEGA